MTRDCLIGRARPAPAPVAFRRWFTLLATLAALAPMSARAQGGVVAGTVVDARTLRGVDGAQVSIEGTALGALSDASGGFRITGVSGTQVTLQVRRIGYRPASQVVRVGQTDIRVSVTEQVATLSELVITGTAEPVEKRAIGNSVTKVDAATVQQIAPSPNVSGLINGRAPGVVLMGGSGAVGSGPRIRVRGAASLSLSDQPLIYIDGIRVPNDVSQGPQSQFFSSGVISRLNDLDPENIESIEVIKGPSAATLYGTEANNGVIQIVTKRGKAGRAVTSLNTRLGQNWFQGAEGRIGKTYRRMPDGSIASWNPVAVEKARGEDLFQKGLSQAYSVGINGGTDVARYNFKRQGNRAHQPPLALGRCGERIHHALQVARHPGVVQHDAGEHQRPARGRWGRVVLAVLRPGTDH